MTNTTQPHCRVGSGRVDCQSSGCSRSSLITLRGVSLCMEHYVTTLIAIAQVSPTVGAFHGDVLRIAASATSTGVPQVA